MSAVMILADAMWLDTWIHASGFAERVADRSKLFGLVWNLRLLVGAEQKP